jgi:hypothetical protein
MTPRWRQIISCYLALCVALAGAVGLSPVLHVMVEHGGHGHAHSHAGFQRSGKVTLEHAHNHPHSHPHSNFHSGSRDQLSRLIAEKYPPQKLFGLELKDVYRAVGGWVAQAFEHLPQAPADNESGSHTHHSLAQMLLNGTVEGVADVPPLVCAPILFRFSDQISSARFSASHFDAQSASRAPPARS